MSAAVDTAPAVTPDTACAHCGLPVGHSPVVEDAAFCCTGCAVVHAALRDTGLDASYYRLRGLTDAPGRPATVTAPPTALDAPDFIGTHTRAVDGGLREATLHVDGVHCAACVWLLEKMCADVDGLADARLDLPRARLTLRFDPATAALPDAARWAARFGYGVVPLRGQDQQRTASERALLVRVGVAWALAGNVMLLTFALYAGLDAGPLATAARWACLALATPALLYGARPFFQRAWAALRLAVRRRDPRLLHMDTPIALGIAVGFGHSAWATVTGTGDVWFDSVTVLIAALLTARWLQLRSRRLAGDASERLLALVPHTVRRLLPDGTIETVAADAIRPGDLVAVPHGEVAPVDGRVEAGRSHLDNAVLTGESRPVPVAPGGRIEAGCTNLGAPLRVRAQAAGEATRVGQLLAWLRANDTHRAPVVLLADRIGGAFVLTVLALAAVTAALWWTAPPATVVSHVAALLIVTCPCALGMATPLALAVASGRAARVGLFLKHDAATQRLTDVDTVVLDKTGTLTEGRATLRAADGPADALGLAAALEASATHPLAEALLCAHAPLGTAEDVREHTGRGLEGRVNGRFVRVGKPAWIDKGAPLTAAQWRRIAAWADRGDTPVAVAVDGRCEALLAFGDAVRPDVPGALAALAGAGHRLVLLSGDHPATVAHVAAELGLDDAHGGVSPEAKRAFVQALQQEGRTVAFVGDGVNDAAALAAADVGIAVAGGATPSLVAADVFLTHDGVRPVVELLRGADRVMRVVRRNLGLSLGYNVLGAAAAMAGLVTPLVAAVAMPLSSLAVVLSSITQRSFAPREDRAVQNRQSKIEN